MNNTDNITGITNFTTLYGDVIKLLQEQLSDNLTYHNVQHTIDVVRATEELAASQDLSEEELLLVKVAALFHDIGFVEVYDGHEEVSTAHARKILPYGFTRQQIEEVCSIIMATKLPSDPVTKMEKIICDADLYYLGTHEFKERSESLYKEFKHYKKVKDRQEWEQKQLAFLTSQKYYTKEAIHKLSTKKEINIKGITMQNNIFKKGSALQFKSHLTDYFLIALGVLSAAFGIHGFLAPNHFFDGGVTGISLLIFHYLQTHPINIISSLKEGTILALLIILLNMPFIVASYFSISKNFAIKTFFAVLLLAFCLVSIHYPDITNDKLLIAIFGGFFIGLGIGLNMRAGAAIDGVEVLALYTIKKTSFTISEIVLAINVLIFIYAALMIDLQTAMYSIITYFTASKTADYVVEGIEAYTGVTIISGESETIKERLVNDLGKGITIYKGERGFLPNNFEVSTDCDIIFTVVTRLELRRLTNMVHQLDPKAFVFANTIKESTGGVLKKLHKH